MTPCPHCHLIHTDLGLIFQRHHQPNSLTCALTFRLRRTLYISASTALAITLALSLCGSSLLKHLNIVTIGPLLAAALTLLVELIIFIPFHKLLINRELACEQCHLRLVAPNSRFCNTCAPKDPTPTFAQLARHTPIAALGVGLLVVLASLLHQALLGESLSSYLLEALGLGITFAILAALAALAYAAILTTKEAILQRLIPEA